MKLPILSSIAILSFALISSPVLASTYVCKFKDAGRHNTIPEAVAIEMRADGTAVVTDAFLLHFGQAPKTAKFARDTTKLLRVRYRAENAVFSDGMRTHMDFSLIYNKKKNRAWITLNLPAFDNTDRGDGSCELVKQL